MLRKVSLVCVLVLSLLILSVPAMASDVTAFTGFTTSGSFRTSPLFGGSVSWDFLKLFSLEQRLALLPQFPQVNGTDPGTWGLNYDTSLAVNAPISSRLVPYGIVGIGFLSTLKNDPLNLGTNLDLIYGGGLKLFNSSKRLGLKFEVRGHRLPSFIGDRGFNTFEFSAGPVFRIGAE